MFKLTKIILPLKLQRCCTVILGNCTVCIYFCKSKCFVARSCTINSIQDTKSQLLWRNTDTCSTSLLHYDGMAEDVLNIKYNLCRQKSTSTSSLIIRAPSSSCGIETCLTDNFFAQKISRKEDTSSNVEPSTWAWKPIILKTFSQIQILNKSYYHIILNKFKYSVEPTYLNVT